jgi:hypothetical protein
MIFLAPVNHEHLQGHVHLHKGTCKFPSDTITHKLLGPKGGHNTFPECKLYWACVKHSLMKMERALILLCSQFEINCQ